MQKKINRTIAETTLTATKVNTVEKTFTDETVTIKGAFSEENVLRALNRKATKEVFYSDPRDLEVRNVYYTMTGEDFVKYGNPGLKPTNRGKYITTHIPQSTSVVLIVSENDETQRIEIETTGMSKAKIKRSVESMGYHFVKILETHREEYAYWMPEDTFIAHATIV